jgi:hypothetical protein
MRHAMEDRHGWQLCALLVVMPRSAASFVDSSPRQALGGGLRRTRLRYAQAVELAREGVPVTSSIPFGRQSQGCTAAVKRTPRRKRSQSALSRVAARSILLPYGSEVGLARRRR